MAVDNTVARSLRDVGLAAWFGGSLIPAMTGAVLVVNARMGEQQRPAQVASGQLGRLRRRRAT